MSPKPGQDAIDQFAEWLDAALKIDNLDLLLLKGHVVVEDALKSLLAAKLGADPLAFRKIHSFPLLVTLAFSGDKSKAVQALKQALIALNTARNHAAHCHAVCHA
jgi:hypothetical protein